MPAARYWRAIGLQAVGGGALELSALHLYLGGVRVDGPATLTSTFAPASGTLAALQDDDTATTARWLDVSAPSFALMWDFGAGATQDVSAVRLGSGGLYAEWLETMTLQHSSNGVVWQTIGEAAAFTWYGQHTMQAVPADGDSYFYSTSLLLHCDGPNGSTAVVDSSFAPKAMTVVGPAAISTAQGLFGGSSLHVGGTAGAAVQAPENTQSLMFGTGDFTVEAWVYASAAMQIDNYPRLLAVGDYLTHGGWNLVYVKPNGGWLALDFYNNGAVALSLSCGTLPDSTWSHVAFTRQGTNVRTFLNGTLQSSGVSGVDLSAVYPFTIGSESSFGGRFKGFYDEIRVTKGVARYVANFTPPSAKFPDVGVGADIATKRNPAPVSAPIPTILSGGSAGDTVAVLPPTQPSIDLQWGGKGTIYGYTKAKGTPPVPVRSRVVLLHQRSKQPVRETWSDPLTGEFWFHEINEREQYLTLAEDAAGNFRPVAANRLEPEVV